MEKVKLFDSIEKAQKLIPNNQVRLIKVRNMLLCISNYQGDLYVTKNECPHMGHPMNQGHLNPFGEIVCPLHTYRFNLKTGVETNNKCKSLDVFTVSVNSEGIYLNY